MSVDVGTQELRTVNLEIGRAEKEHDVAFLDGVLHDELIFRRADGTFAGKEEYLADLAEREYEALAAEVTDIDEKPDSTVVTVLVTARGTRGGARFAGTFRNTRTFIREDARWRCRVWVNVRAGVEIRGIHHVSLPVTDLERSKRFYREILGLREIERPPFDFPGAWFEVGADQLHLIVGGESTFRGEKGVDARDVHFAVRVRSFRDALEFLQSKGYREEADEGDTLKMKVSPRPVTGFPQIYVVDPDRHVIEINAEKLDL